VTGFDFGYRDTKEQFPDRLKPLLGECWPAYELLRQHALKPLPAVTVPRCVRDVVITCVIMQSMSDVLWIVGSTGGE